MKIQNHFLKELNDAYPEKILILLDGLEFTETDIDSFVKTFELNVQNFMPYDFFYFMKIKLSNQKVGDMFDCSSNGYTYVFDEHRKWIKLI